MNGHALVIGGSLAGLLAARVLAEHFEHVTIVDRDRFPDGPEARKGLPQARHVHVLLCRGQNCLENLFPGLQAELERAGAPRLDWIGDARWFSFGGWAPVFPSAYFAHPCSRDLLEWLVRSRLRANPRVNFLEEHEAIDLLTTADRSRVTGVVLRNRGQADHPIVELTADLLVDASGRETRTPHWLETLGCRLPADSMVNSFLGYASRVYRAPAGGRAWQSMLVRGTPPKDRRGGVINPIEDGRWMVTLAGAGRDYPPTEEAAFLAFARSLPVPDLHEAIREAEPLSPIWGYRKTENRWHHYERMQRWPENWIVLGDAVCAFNPVYGQGMTAAALGATLLEEQLRAAPTGGITGGFARTFQRRLARVIRGPWLMATGDDYRYAETEGGRRSFATRLLHAYMDGVMALANQDEQVFGQFFRVFQLLSPISTLFRPEIWLKLLARRLRPAG